MTEPLLIPIDQAPEIFACVEGMLRSNLTLSYVRCRSIFSAIDGPERDELLGRLESLFEELS